MTSQDIIDSLILISPTPERIKAHNQLIADLKTIERMLPKELENIYNHLLQGNTQLAFHTIKACSGEIRVRTLN